MNHRRFAWLSSALLALLFTLAGVLSLLGKGNAEIIFWGQRPVETTEGKITWIAVSTICLIFSLSMAAGRHRDDPERGPK